MKERIKILFGPLDIGNLIRQKALFSVIEKKDLAEKRILDAGCGAGDNCLRLAYRHPEALIEGIDIEDKKIAAGAALGQKLGTGNLKFRRADLSLPFEKEKYDLAYCVDVLEHIVNDHAAVGNLSASLKHGGTLVIHIPLNSQRRYFKKFADWRQDDHVRDGYQKEKLIELLEANRLSPIDQKYTFGPFGALAWEVYESAQGKSKLIKIVALLATRPLASLDAHRNNSWGNALLIRAEKKEGGGNGGA